MEKRLNQRFSQWTEKFKQEIRSRITGIEDMNKETMASFLEFLYGYESFVVRKEDLQKRRRVKNLVPYHDRCRALRANQEQCTRRRKCDSRFCGTHAKGIPHGEVSETIPKKSVRSIQIWAQEIGGIISHLDDFGNVYDPQDIYQNIKNPRIIAKYLKDAEGNYSLRR
jgi:hypothetical protein